jgi:predicted enzyme related to lactoylglutathione lyase
MFKGVYPISGEDLNALPVREIGRAVEFYKTVLGFSVVSSDATAAILKRDAAQLGLVRKPDHKSTEAGSCVFAVTDLDAIHKELDGRGNDLGGIRIDEWDGKKYRVFFLRETENGYCFCFSQPA